MSKSASNTPTPTIQTSKQQLLNAEWQLQTKAQSYEFGRRLYVLKTAQQQFWLKFHAPQQNLQSQDAFQYELSCYAALRGSGLLLPHAVLDLAQFPQVQFSTGSGLLMAHSDSYLQGSCRPFGLPQILQKIKNVLAALANLHHRGWLHGDIKHEHFVAFNSRCYLIDFEQSRMLKGPILPHSATPRYMAPELFQGADKTIQTDLYALGIVFWEWLSAQRIAAQSYYDWATWHSQQHSTRLTAPLNCLQPLLDGLLSKRLAQRFSSADEALQLLQHQHLL